MFTQRPFSINYLGRESSNYLFFVNIGDVNSFVFKQRNVGNAFSLLSALEPSVYHGVYDENLNFVENFAANGQFAKLQEYTAPLQKTIEITESSSIYLKIPKIPIGSGYNSGHARQLWFLDRLDNSDFQNLLMWIDQFEITATIDYSDFLFTQKEDKLEKNLINQPIGTVEKVGSVYIKIGEITINENSVSIKQFYNSNLFASSRYVTIGQNVNRWLRIHFVGREIYSDSSYSTVFGDYSRPDWTIKSNQEIFDSCKQTIQNDFNNFYVNWEAVPGIGIAKLDIVQIHALYKESCRGNILAKEIFRDDNYPTLLYENTPEGLSFAFPGLNKDYITIVTD